MRWYRLADQRDTSPIDMRIIIRNYWKYVFFCGIDVSTLLYIVHICNRIIYG